MRHRCRVLLLGMAMLACAAPAGAFPLRSPQVVFASAALQAKLDALDPGARADASQLDASVWSTASLGTRDFTVMRQAGNAAGLSFGLYDATAAVPQRLEILPAAVTGHWFAAVHFWPQGNFAVALYDSSFVFQGQTTYNVFIRGGFGFYVEGPCGTWYSQDARNPGPQMLAYPGAGGTDPVRDVWLAASACPSSPASAFTDDLVEIQGVYFTPAHAATWGQLKAHYR